MLSDIWAAIDEARYTEAERLLGADRELLAARAGQMALGYLYAHTRRFDEARGVYANLRQLHAGDQWEHIAVHQQGVVERLAGEYPAALALFEQERALIAALGDRPHKQSVNAYELGIVRLAMGQLPEARAELERSLESAGRQDDPEAMGCAERGLGDLSAAEGHHQVARLHYQRARQAFEDAEDAPAVREVEARLAGLEPHEA